MVMAKRIVGTSRSGELRINMADALTAPGQATHEHNLEEEIEILEAELTRILTTHGGAKGVEELRHLGLNGDDLAFAIVQGIDAVSNRLENLKLQLAEKTICSGQPVPDEAGILTDEHPLTQPGIIH